jgi:hypothetical protein
VVKKMKVFMIRIIKIGVILLLPILLLGQCRFKLITQPSIALPGEVITVQLDVEINIVPEPNPHKGVLCILIPADWSVTKANYTSSHADGSLTFSQAWTDSAKMCYPLDQFGENMQWVGMISDTGFTYEESFEVRILLDIQTGETEGCYNLGYIATKATRGLLCAGDGNWAPFSYPHPISLSASGELCDTIEVERADNWNNLFHRTSGWTGADGIYSIPLSGIETPEGNPEEKTLFLFSDTFIGEVENNERLNSSLVNNTYAVLYGNEPLEQNADFFWGRNQSNQPDALFIPNTPQSNPGDWYWMMDGIAMEDSFRVFALRLQTGSGGLFNFELVGVALISFQLDALDSIQIHRQIDTPLYHKNEEEGWEIVLGQAIMPMTERSKNPEADGYIYVYGPKNSSGPKEMVAARVLSGNITDFSSWRYWNGTDWGESIEDCAPITNNISQEFSVSPLGDGQYIAVFQIGSNVAIRLGESPVGPFGVLQNIYDCPEVLEDPDIFVYNAKAHPHLSQADQLLISYNVNTFDFWDHFSDAGIYRPRFITMTVPGATAVVASEDNYFPDRFILSQNYPNPFNPTTIINYELPNTNYVHLSIYNLVGQRVQTLVSGRQQAGHHQIEWNASGFSSGVYFYHLQVGELHEVRKMVLLK